MENKIRGNDTFTKSFRDDKSHHHRHHHFKPESNHQDSKIMNAITIIEDFGSSDDLNAAGTIRSKGSDISGATPPSQQQELREEQERHPSSPSSSPCYMHSTASDSSSLPSTPISSSALTATTIPLFRTESTKSNIISTNLNDPPKDFTQLMALSARELRKILDKRGIPHQENEEKFQLAKKVLDML